MSGFFHFTLGPVQSFVAQARRTRDYWAGSFLLSWLAGVAMKTVIAQGGRIVFPQPDAGYLAWLEGQGAGQPPRQGGIPNRFKAEVGENFQPVSVEQAVCAAWKALAERVWQEDLARHDQRYPDSRAIWDRQIGGFWEIAWVLGDDDALLDRRKNWRTQLPPVEAGVKCSVMTGWQELSGLPAPDAKVLNAFWQPVRADCGRDLAEDEALCAIAFVKRRFPHCFEQVRVEMAAGWTLRGWRVDPRTPSTLDLAAANWLARVVRDESEPVLRRLHESAERLPFLPGDCGVDRLHCVGEAYRARGLRPLNSSVLFTHVLDNPRECPDRQAAQAMKRAVKVLALKELPAPFYAILLMDGDSLGQLLRQSGPVVSRALDRFTGQVPPLVDRHNGFLIYAGGDDVLALLPLEDALACAAAVRQCYLDAFRTAFGTAQSPSTISAAVEYAHVKLPLTRILGDAHELLDAVAKDGRGRDALAVRVWKPGGQTLEWAMPWKAALDRDGHLAIAQLAARFAGDEADARGKDADRFSSKFFYKIRERFDLLNPPRVRLGHEEEAAIFKDDDALSLLAVDYLASGINEGRQPQLTLPDAKRIIQPLLRQCRPVVRSQTGDAVNFSTSNRLEADGALLVRFLAHKGVETR